MATKAVIFDFFGVFCAPIASAWLRKVAPGDTAKQAAFQALCTQSDLGKLSRADFNTAASKLTGVPVPEVEQGIEAQTVINTALVSYVEKLKNEGYRIACLSNGSHEWTLKVIEDHDLGRLFEVMVISSELGIIKPDPKIYAYTLQRLQLRPEEIVFVDDRESNTVAAEACGMPSLVFTDTPTFIRQFEALVHAAGK